MLPEPCSNPSKNILETLTRQTPGAPVVAAAVVAIDQQAAVGQRVRDVVAEDMILEFEFIGPENRLMGDGTQRDNDFQARHCCQLGLEMAIALADFGGGRLVGGRQATNGIGDPAVGQMQGRIRPSIRPQCIGKTGETETMQRRVEQFTSHVPGKWAAGTVGSFFARAEADHQQFCIQRTKSGNGKRVPIRVAPANGRKVFSQAGAGCTVLRIVK